MGLTKALLPLQYFYSANRLSAQYQITVAACRFLYIRDIILSFFLFFYFYNSICYFVKFCEWFLPWPKCLAKESEIIFFFFGKRVWNYHDHAFAWVATGSYMWLVPFFIFLLLFGPLESIFEWKSGGKKMSDRIEKIWFSLVRIWLEGWKIPNFEQR